MTVPKPVRLHLMHASMQFSDPSAQQRSDVEKIFDRCVERNIPWVTGTEAGAGAFRKIIQEGAQDHGYRFAAKAANDSWIAVQRSFVKRDWNVYYEKTVETGEGLGRHGPRGVFAVDFEPELPLGHITIMAGHYLTKGRPGAKGEYSTNVPINVEMAKGFGAYAKKMGKGSALVFYHGDQNIVDRTGDTFMGEPLTSSWDELKKWENTGHGNIDVIASYDHDGRVSAAYCRALDDSEFKLYTDHFVVEAGFDVVPLEDKGLVDKVKGAIPGVT